MKNLRILLTIILSVFTWLPSPAAETAADDPGRAAETFYAGYIAQVEANKDTKAWVAGSRLVTEKFKKAYAKAMNAEEIDADPVLNAQDVPSKPFKAEKPEIKDTTATVSLVTSFGDGKHKVIAKLQKVDGVWLLDSVK